MVMLSWPSEQRTSSGVAGALSKKLKDVPRLRARVRGPDVKPSNTRDAGDYVNGGVQAWGG